MEKGGEASRGTWAGYKLVWSERGRRRGEEAGTLAEHALAWSGSEKGRKLGGEASALAGCAQGLVWREVYEQEGEASAWGGYGQGLV